MFNKEYRHFLRDNRPTPLVETEGKKLSSNIEVINDQKEDQRLSVSEGDGHICLNDYLPAEVNFAGLSDGQFRFWKDDSGSAPWRSDCEYKIEFPLDKINNLSGRLGLLHEIGHARNFSSSSQVNEYEFFIRELTDNLKYSIKNSEDYKKIQDLRERDNFFINKFKQDWRGATQEFRKNIPNFPYQNAIQAIEYIVESERNAWAEGLKLYRLIQKENKIDLFAGVSHEEIFDSINYAMGTYEKEWSVFINNEEGPSSLKEWIKKSLGMII